MPADWPWPPAGWACWPPGCQFAGAPPMVIMVRRSSWAVAAARVEGTWEAGTRPLQ